MGKLTHTVKGPIASFRSADKADIESLKLHFLPKQEGSGDPSPANIRPITGWTSVNIHHEGKNLFDKNNINLIYARILSTGQIDAGISGASSRTIYIECKPNTTYSIRKLPTSRCVVCYSSETPIADMYIEGYASKSDQASFTYTTGSNAKYLLVYLYNANYDTSITESEMFASVQIEYGSVINSYESYHGNIIPLSWSDHGVEYGGYVDPVRGKLVAEWACETDNGRSWNVSSYGNAWQWGHSHGNDPDAGGMNYYRHTLCSHCKNISVSLRDNAYTIGLNQNGALYLGKEFWKLMGYENNITAQEAQDFFANQALAGTPVYICSPLETPIEYDIDPIALQTFLDYNNFWTDMNDDTEVEYCFADRLSERKLIMDTPHIESASGTITSFNTDMKAPLVDLKARFTPVQEGAGDPSPTNVRPIHGWTGANISTVDAYEFYQGGLADLTGEEVSINTRIRTDYIPYDGSQSLVFNGVFDSDDRFRSIYWYDSNKEFISSGGSNHDFPYYHCVGNHPDYAYFRVVVYKSDNTKAISPNGKRLVLPKETYPVKFPATKNLLDITQYGRHDGGKGFVASDGIVSFDEVNGGNSCIVWGSQTFPAGTYTLNAKVSGDGTIGFRLLCSSASCGGTYNSYYGGYFINSIDNNSKITFTTTESFTIGICLLSNSQHEKEPGMAYDIQLERGSTATAYEPYGTVYGGYVDLIRGKVVSTYQKIILDGINYAIGNYGNSSYNGTEATNRGITIPRTGILTNDKVDITKVFSSKLIPTTNSIWNNPNNYKWHFTIYNHSQLHVCFDNSVVGITSDMDWTPRTQKIKEWLAENNIIVILPLETPIEYDLTPQQIKTLKGINNIWSDANGAIDVKYWTH